MSTIWIAQYRPRSPRPQYPDAETGWRIYGDPVLLGWTHKGWADAFVRDKNEPTAYWNRSDFEWRTREYAATQLGAPRWFVGRRIDGVFQPVAGAFDSKERAEGYRNELFGDCEVIEYGPK